MTAQFAADKATAARLWDAARIAAAPLKLFPRGPMGLTPDAVKATPEWQAAKRASDAAIQRLQQFNRRYLKVYAAELRAERDDKRREREAGHNAGAAAMSQEMCGPF